MKIFIASSREIGQRCIEWAREHFELSDSMDDCDVFISVLYDKIIPQEYISKRPCFNFHPGILPWYRGAGAFSWVLINGEVEAGVTLHEIDAGIDTGNIIDIRRFPIIESDTAETLFRQAEDLIFIMFKEWVSSLVEGNYPTVKQTKGRIYYRKDLDRAKDITNIVRAFTFEGKDSCFYINKDGKKIICNL